MHFFITVLSGQIISQVNFSIPRTIHICMKNDELFAWHAVSVSIWDKLPSPRADKQLRCMKKRLHNWHENVLVAIIGKRLTIVYYLNRLVWYICTFYILIQLRMENLFCDIRFEKKSCKKLGAANVCKNTKEFLIMMKNSESRVDFYYSSNNFIENQLLPGFQFTSIWSCFCRDIFVVWPISGVGFT